MELRERQTEERKDNCTRHPRNPLELRCLECNVSVCMKCYAVSHRNHACQEIEEYAQDLMAKLVDQDIESAKSQHAKAVSNLKQLKDENNAFLRGVEATQKSIRRRAAELKRMINKRAAALLDELESVKTEVRCEVEINEAELEFEVQRLNSLVDYCTHFRTQTNPFDITRSVDRFYANIAEQLRTGDRLGYHVPYVEFAAGNSDGLAKLDDCFGRLQIRNFASELLC